MSRLFEAERVEVFAQSHTEIFVLGIELGINNAREDYAPDLTEQDLGKHLEIINMAGELTEESKLNLEAYCLGKAVGYEVEIKKIREKTSTGSASAESGFIPEGAIGKTVGLSYKPEAQL